MAHVQITVGGALVRLRPKSTSNNRFSVEIDQPTSILQCLTRLGATKDTRVLAILNGNVVQSADFDSTVLVDADELSLMPPIQAG